MRSISRLCRLAAAIATAMFSACDKGGDGPTGPTTTPTPVYCSDGRTLVQNGDYSGCPIVRAPEVVSVSPDSIFVLAQRSPVLTVKLTVNAAGTSTWGNQVTVALTVNGTSSTSGIVEVPEGDYAICATATSSTGVKTSGEVCKKVHAFWPRVSGQVMAGGNPALGQWVSAESVSVQVDALGRFNIPVSADVVRVDVNGSGQLFENLVWSASTRQPVTVITTRKTFTLPPGGILGEQTLDVDFREAVALSNPALPFGGNNCSYYPSFKDPEGNWEVMMPWWRHYGGNKFAFDAGFTEAEKVAVRQRLSADFAAYTTLAGNYEVPLSEVQQFGTLNGVLIKKDPNLPSWGQGGFTVVDGHTGEITGGVITLREFTPGTILHEWWHVLGFCHSFYGGIMNVTTGGLSNPSVRDVAYLLLMKEFTEAERQSSGTGTSLPTILSAQTGQKWISTWSGVNASSLMSALMGGNKRIIPFPRE